MHDSFLRGNAWWCRLRGGGGWSQNHYIERWLNSPWISRASGWQTERADCNYIFEKITYLENYFNKDKSVGL